MGNIEACEGNESAALCPDGTRLKICDDGIIRAVCSGVTRTYGCDGQIDLNHGVQWFSFSSSTTRSSIFRDRLSNCQIVDQFTVSGSASGVVVAAFNFDNGLPPTWEADAGIDQYDRIFRNTRGFFYQGQFITVIEIVAFNEERNGTAADTPSLGFQGVNDEGRVGCFVRIGSPSNCINDPEFGQSIIGDWQRETQSGSVYRWSRQTETERVRGDEGCQIAYSIENKIIQLTPVHSAPYYPPGWSAGTIDCGPPLQQQGNNNTNAQMIEAFSMSDPVRRCRGCGG